jgi:hypothetical protein
LDFLPDVFADPVVAALPCGLLLVWDWSAAEFNAGSYAELRVFKNVLKKICAYGAVVAQIQLRGGLEHGANPATSFPRGFLRAI